MGNNASTFPIISNNKSICSPWWARLNPFTLIYAFGHLTCSYTSLPLWHPSSPTSQVHWRGHLGHSPSCLPTWRRVSAHDQIFPFQLWPGLKTIQPGCSMGRYWCLRISNKSTVFIVDGETPRIQCWARETCDRPPGWKCLLVMMKTYDTKASSHGDDFTFYLKLFLYAAVQTNKHGRKLQNALQLVNTFHKEMTSLQNSQGIVFYP